MRRGLAARSGAGREHYFSHGTCAPAYEAVDRQVYDRVGRLGPAQLCRLSSMVAPRPYTRSLSNRTPVLSWRSSAWVNEVGNAPLTCWRGPDARGHRVASRRRRRERLPRAGRAEGERDSGLLTYCGAGAVPAGAGAGAAVPCRRVWRRVHRPICSRVRDGVRAPVLHRPAAQRHQGRPTAQPAGVCRDCMVGDAGIELMAIAAWHPFKTRRPMSAARNPYQARTLRRIRTMLRRKRKPQQTWQRPGAQRRREQRRRPPRHEDRAGDRIAPTRSGREVGRADRRHGVVAPYRASRADRPPPSRLRRPPGAWLRLVCGKDLLPSDPGRGPARVLLAQARE